MSDPVKRGHEPEPESMSPGRSGSGASRPSSMTVAVRLLILPGLSVFTIAAGLAAAPTGGAAPAGAAGTPASPSAPAARKTDASQAVSARVFTIKFRDPSDVALVISSLLSDKGSVTTVPKLRTVTIQDRRDVLDRIGAVIASYDVPLRNVEFTITLILATRSDEARQPISREVRGISETLPNITKWTDYKTLGSSTIAGSEGSMVALDIAEYHVEFDLQSVSDTHGIIRLSPFTLQKSAKGEDGVTAYRPVYKQTVNLKNDRLLTIGATKSEASARALFLAIRAHIQGD